MTRAIIFDTETTGKADPILIEAAWLTLDSLNPFLTSESFNQRYNPNKKIELAALATHHILDEELIDCPSSTTFNLPDNTEYLIGHNIDYDWNVIGQPNIKRICTLALARMVWPELDAHNQSALLYFVDRQNARDKLKNAHSALADVENCTFILEKIISKLTVTTIEELWIVSEQARIPTHMTFGKHKGVAIADIPRDYKDWLLGQNGIEEHLRMALLKN
jgi:exodeoxyribonuclease X